MPAHPFQTNFTAGELTEQLLARVDWQKYANGAACLKNFLVRPHGGAARRAGTLYVGAVKDPTARVRLVKFEFSITQAYMLEVGPHYIRVWANRAPVLSGGVPVEVATPYTQTDLRELRFEQSADVLYIAHRHHAPRKLERLSATEFRLQVINFNPPPTFEQEVFPAATLTLTAATGDSVTATASAAVFLAGDLARQIRSGPGRAVIMAVLSTTQVRLNILDDFTTTGPIASGDWSLDGSPNAGTLTPSIIAPINAVITLTSSLAAFRASDVGAFLFLTDGIVKITTFTSTTVVVGVIVKVLRVVTAAPAGTWTLERPAWSDALGYPGVVALHDQRLWWAGSDQFPDGLWASVVGDYEVFAVGPADDDAVFFQLAESGVNLIRWLKSLSEGLGVGTLAAELTISGGIDQPITPSAVNVKNQTAYGADYTVDAIRVSNVVLFLQRGALRLREFAFDFVQTNAFVAPDLTIIAEHLTRLGLVELAYASSPDSIVFAIRPDGILLSLTYERIETVVGWAHHETDGLFESIAVIPNNCGTGDELWVAVGRSVTGGAYWATGYWHADYWHANYWALAAEVQRRYIEIFDGGANTDASLFYAGAAAGTFTGLNHLEGLTVKAITEDGRVYDLVVTGGSITLPDGATATELEVGLHFTSSLQTLRPELATPIGTAQGRTKHWNHVTLRVACTHGVLTLNGEPVEYPEGVTVGPAALFTGDMHRKFNLGWDREGQLLIQTTEPKPCTILGITGAIQLDDG